jgi:hypothetical protein
MTPKSLLSTLQVGGLLGISSTWRSPIMPGQGGPLWPAKPASKSRPLDAV